MCLTRSSARANDRSHGQRRHAYGAHTRPGGLATFRYGPDSVDDEDAPVTRTHSDHDEPTTCAECRHSAKFKPGSDGSAGHVHADLETAREWSSSAKSGLVVPAWAAALNRSLSVFVLFTRCIVAIVGGLFCSFELKEHT